MSAAPKRLRARVGDVFRIQFAPGQSVYGQVIDRTGPQYLVVVFRGPAETPQDALRNEIDLAAIVFDAKFRNGDWPIVANLPPVRVNEPWFVLGHEGLENLRLENFDSSKTQMVRATAAARHGHRSLSYPMALQLAVEAIHGTRDWIQEMDSYRELAVELTSVRQL